MINRIVYRKISWRKPYFGMTGSWTGSGTLVSLFDSSDRKSPHRETVHCGIYEPLAVRDFSETDLTNFLCVLMTFYTAVYSSELNKGGRTPVSQDLFLLF